MPKQTFLTGREDMKWLRDVHLTKLGKSYKAAVIYGNEDWPDRIEVYKRAQPDYDDPFVAYEPDEDGVYHRVDR